MVKVREEQPLLIDGSVNMELWLCKLNEKNPALNLSRLRQACDLSEKAEEKAIATNTVWSAGRSSYRIGLDMADILSELHMDEDGIVAAIIYRAVRENQITLNHVRNTFGENVATLVEGVLRMAAISKIKFSDQSVLGEQKDQLEQAKRLLVALVDDVRVALIKLAERTCAIRAISNDVPEKRLRLAREVMEIYAPLAHRLGIGHLKWELEDFAFRYLEPTAYKRIASLLDEKRTDRQSYIDQVLETLQKKLKVISVDAQVDGRAKHIYSIWRKMRNKGITFSQVYDVRAFRILVPDDNDCYRVLGVVHNLWRHIPHEFDDYIANPKENGYRSLHTAVFGPDNRVLEIQIRTHDMHEEAELGVCSHWQYKSRDQEEEPAAVQQRLQWLRQILDWREELDEVAGISKELLDEISLDRIYVFTPEGHVVDMMPDATPVDFAYRVHTEVGHKCRGAKVNGKVVPLNTRLKSGDQIEIIVGDEAEPRREWLYAHLGYIVTSRARAKVQSWFGHRTRRKNIAEGKRLLDDELRQLAVEQFGMDAIVKQLGYTRTNDLYASIGAGDVNVYEVVERIMQLVELDLRDQQLSLLIGEDDTDQKTERLITGQGNLETDIADCCAPVPGDSIVGILKDDGRVAVHRQDCLQALQGDSYGRMMRLDWREEISAGFAVSIEIDAYDRYGLLHDITGLFMQGRTNVLTLNSNTEKTKNRVLMEMTIEIRSIHELLTTLEQIEQLPNVISARRILSA
ncbi:MAG: bifunctional (p)ppGpp synthetase/guanosine-3',5'-bis(diphosphate) 3'-pyrophosphohydrolase [Pseudomonadales bacterium]|nr:bifunctional (p)ppGpp synthetase/guanosine-3',5'-bis(diphosphate) 3'-pyrophosphohydrolase [Pseudomonadales bacterium]